MVWNGIKGWEDKSRMNLDGFLEIKKNENGMQELDHHGSQAMIPNWCTVMRPSVWIEEGFRRRVVEQAQCNDKLL